MAVAEVHHNSRFACAKCGFTRAIGAKFPSVIKLLEKFALLDSEIARAKVVDALTAWYLDWSDFRE